MSESIEDLLVIFLLWCFLPWALLWISGKMWLVGIYHELKTNENPTGEEFKIKIRSIFACNFSLSLPLIPALFTTITTTIDEIPFNHAALLTLIISSALLLVFRITANPSKYFAELLEIDKAEDIHRHKDNVLSFFYSFICAALIIQLIIESYGIFSNQMIRIPSFEIGGFITVLFSYTLLIVISTLIGELILKYICRPVMVNGYNKRI